MEPSKENKIHKLTSAAALEIVTLIEDLNARISAVYRETGERYGVSNINLVRDIVKAREEAADRRLEADGLLESIDIEDDNG